MSDNNFSLSRVEEILKAALTDTEYGKVPQSRIEYLILELINKGGGGGGGGAGGYTPSGSAYFDDLPTPSKDYLGYVYNMLEDFTTTNDFLEGAGKTYSAGSNVVIVDAGSVDNPRYMYDVLSGFIDLSGYEPLIFFGTMAEWEALSDAEKAKYKTLKIPDTRIEDIEALIPSTATTSNKLTTAGDLANKVDKSGTDRLMTLAEATKLDGIEAGAEVNVQSNWDESDSTSDAYIKNKPSIPTSTSDLQNDSGFITKAVDDLTNYYLKSEIYSKSEVDDVVATKVDKHGTDRLMTASEADKLSGIEAGAEVNIQSDWNESDNTSDAYIQNKPSIPNSTSDLQNDSGFITNAVSNLINYYLKSEAYNKTEVDSIIAAVKNSRFEFVSVLPTTDIQTNVIYLVPKSSAQTSNAKDEYINLDGTTSGWEKIGDTEIDLSGYVTTAALNVALAEYTTTANLTTLLNDKQDKTDNTLRTTAKTVTGAINEVFASIATKQSQITQSSLLTLTVADWDTTTLQQTVSFAHDTTKRNVIDITIGEMTTWGECDVRAVSETATGITFECDTVPETALTFTVTSMEVN